MENPTLRATARPQFFEESFYTAKTQAIFKTVWTLYSFKQWPAQLRRISVGVRSSVYSQTSWAALYQAVAYQFLEICFPYLLQIWPLFNGHLY